MPRDDIPQSRNVKLTDAEWSALERIARHHGLVWGGIPSRSEAVRLLIRQQVEGATLPAQNPERWRAEAILRRIRTLAEAYEVDGQPGPRGYNCWGWSEIARELRKIADEAAGE